MKQHDKLMTDLQRLLANQDFKSEDDSSKFMDSMGWTKNSFVSERGAEFQGTSTGLSFCCLRTDTSKGESKY